MLPVGAFRSHRKGMLALSCPVPVGSLLWTSFLLMRISLILRLWRQNSSQSSGPLSAGAGAQPTVADFNDTPTPPHPGPGTAKCEKLTFMYFNIRKTYPKQRKSGRYRLKEKGSVGNCGRAPGTESSLPLPHPALLPPSCAKITGVGFLCCMHSIFNITGGFGF